MVRKAAEPSPDIKAHPLFPLDDAEDDAFPAVVTTIHVRRLEAGDWKTVPAAFGPEQLTSWEQVYTAWGGGKYELVARDDHGRISARVTETLPGDSAPLVPAREAPPAAQAPQAMAAGLGADAGGIMGLMLQMLVNQQQQSQNMFLQFLERSDRAAQVQQQTMGAMYAQSSQLMATIFGKLADQKESGRPEEVFMRGIETATALRQGMGEVAQQQGAGSELASIAETVRVVGQSIAAAQAAPTTMGAIADGAAAVAAAGKAVS